MNWLRHLGCACSLLLGFGLTVAAWGQESPDGASSLPVRDDSLVAHLQPEGQLAAEENIDDAIKMLSDACVLDRRLHGAWVYLKLEDTTPRRFRARVLVDSAKADEQLRLIQGLLAKLPLNPKPQIEQPVLQAPLSQLLRDLRPRTESVLQQRGRFVQGAYYSLAAPGFDDLKLVLFGRGADDPLKNQVIRNECTTMVSESPAWQQLVQQAKIDIIPTDDGLKQRPVSERLKSIRDRVIYYLGAETALQGSWVELAECYDANGQFMYFDATTWLDKARAGQQRMELSRMLRQTLNADFEVVDEVELPLSRTLQAINLHIEACPPLDGCYLDGAFYTGTLANDGEVVAVKLVPFGRVANDQQLPKLEALLTRLMAGDQGDFAWRKVQVEPSVSVDGPMAIVAPNYARGAQFFNDGLREFWRCNYPDALQRFEMATVNAPGTLEYRYWRVLAELQMGMLDQAYQHMLAIVRREPSPFAQRRVLVALERVQGPIRMTLLQLEERAQTDFYINRPKCEEIMMPAADPGQMAHAQLSASP